MKKSFSCLTVMLLTLLLTYSTAYGEQRKSPKILLDSVKSVVRFLNMCGIPAFVNPEDIVITQPLDGMETTASKISIFGACDYNYPLYLNGEEIPVTDNGFFAHYVELVEGENQFVFENNDKEKSIKVIKKDASRQSTAPEISYTRPQYGVVNMNYITQRPRPDESAELLTPFMKGTTFKLIGENYDYLKIQGGGYIYKGTANIYGGEPPVAKITVVSAKSEDRLTYVKFAMNGGALYDIRQDGDRATLKLWNVADNDRMPDVSGTLISGVRKSHEEGGIIYEFTFDRKLIGHYVQFERGEMTVGFKHAATDLSDMTVVLDAGHGGEDSGALGPLAGTDGGYGPIEKDFNLYVTLSAKKYLEGIGVNVHLTRGIDEQVALSARVSEILEVKPDISVSVHTNAMPVSSDFNLSKGPLMFYSFDTGAQAAEHIHQYITEHTDREYKPPIRENFALTRITNCPAILFEMGFISNPDDYEWLLKTGTLDSLGKALGEGIESYLRLIAG